MALRLAIRRSSPQLTALQNVGLGFNPIVRATRAQNKAIAIRPTTQRNSIRYFSSTLLKRNYNYGYNLPPPEPAKPSRSTTFFRIVNSLTGLAVVYLLYIGVDALEVLTGTIMQMQANQARDHFDTQLDRVQSEEMTARDRDYERRLLRWRQASRGDMVDLDEQMR